jgi:hypothetical protein
MDPVNNEGPDLRLDLNKVRLMYLKDDVGTIDSC